MGVLPLPNDDRLSPINAVPGLYVSSRVAASSPSKLSSEGITHIVSVLKDNELSFRQNAQGDWCQFEIKQIAIDDDGDEDILIHLDDVYQWIEQALSSAQPADEEHAFKKKPKPQVLIHCRQGISRSGAFVVGYLMKKRSLSYSNALQLARASREAVTPNDGFEKQLRIWEHCKYDIYLPEQGVHSEPISSPGPDKAERQLAAKNATQQSSSRNPKAAYKVWKRERDSRLASNGDDRGHVTSMANMAAEFGKRRLEAQEKRKKKATAAATAASTPVSAASSDPKRRSSNHLPVSRSQTRRGSDAAASDSASSESESKTSNDETDDDKTEDDKTEAQWRRVEEMEKLWNDKLIRGEVERAKETGDLEKLMTEVFGSIKDEV